MWWILDPAPIVNEPWPFGLTCKNCDGGSKVAMGKSAVVDAASREEMNDTQ